MEEYLYFLLFNRLCEFRISFSQIRDFLFIVFNTVLRVNIATNPLKMIFRLFRY